MKKKLVITVAVAMTLSLAGCGSKAVTDKSTVITEEATSIEAESAVEATQAVTEMPVEDDVTFGKVTSIDGDTITVALGEMDLSESALDKPEGDVPSGDKPEGKAPSRDDKEMPFKESGETIAITLDDTIIIQVQDGGNRIEGTSDNIVEGSLISMIYDVNGKVISIEVMGQGRDTVPAEMETMQEANN